jgi:pimeloyl-ACP methyl ester carboxylesterase
VTATRFERTVIVVSKHVLIVLWLIAYLAANARAAEISAPTGIRADGKPADFDHFWSQALVRLQGWPPILYLTDRPECENFDPGNTHSWAMLDLRAVAQATQTTGPDPILQPTYRAILLARRALALLIGKSQPAHLRAGLVGEGSGGGVALALAALCPDQVAFVAAHQPVLSKAGQPYLDLPNFVAGVRCPALLSYGDRDEVAPAEEVIALYEKLRCDRELAEFDGARHCQPKDLRDWSRVWRAWIGEVLGLTSPSPCSTESAATCS